MNYENTLTPNEVSDLLDGMINLLIHKKRRLTLFLWGGVGIGKTSLIRQAGERHNIPVYLERLTDKETIDYTGAPIVTEGKTAFAPPARMPTTGPCILFLDELPQALLPMKNIASQIIDGNIGEWKIPEGCLVVIAGNRMEDRAGTQITPQNIIGRCIHAVMAPRYEDWSGWAGNNGIDPRILAFLDARQSNCDELLFNPSNDGKPSPSPRTWEYVSDALKMKLPESLQAKTIKGAIGEGVGTEFSGFLQMYENIVDWRMVLKYPTGAELPNGPAPTMALMNNLARNVSMDTINNLFIYLGRVHPEMAQLCVAQIENYKPELKETKAYTDWAIKHANKH